MFLSAFLSIFRGFKCHETTLALSLSFGHTLLPIMNDLDGGIGPAGNKTKLITKATRPFSINKIGWRLLSNGLL